MSNYLNNAINGSVRVMFVILPTVKAATHLLTLAQRTLNAGLGLIGINPSVPKLGEDTPQSKVYTFIHGYLPKPVTHQNKDLEAMTNSDLVKATVFYTATAIVATFVANKFIGPMPEIYNTISMYAGNALRIDRNFDVIQMAINYVRQA